MFHLCISLPIAISVILHLAQLTFIFICCHFNIYVEFIINQQVKHPQPMTAVTGKFVLKCRITNITTLLDISLFYVYKFYIIYFSQVQHKTAIPRVGVASSTILKTIKEFRGEQLPLAQNHFYTQKRVQKWSFLKIFFKQYDYQNGTYILTHRPYKCSYLLRRESTERSGPDISLSLCIIETNESFSNVNAVVIMNPSHRTRAGSL